MAIGQHVAKYQAEKEARAKESEPVDTPVEAPSPNAPITQSDFLAAMQLLLSAIRSSEDPTAKERALLEAERLTLEHERLKREMPENKQAPGISVYSYPEGDLAHPKPELKCKMSWVGYPLSTDTLTPAEVDALNAAQPGEFKVTKANGDQIPFRVTAKHNDRFQLEALDFWFPCKGDHRHDHNSMLSYLRQATGEVIPSVEDLMAELTRLKAELQSARTGVGA